MRLLAALVLGVIVFSGCARNKQTVWPASGSAVPRPVVATPVMTNTVPKPIVTPELALVGKVVRFSSEGRFVVLNFPIGHLPGEHQRLNVYRQGLKVGEVKVTGPQRDDNTVADIVTGEAQVGDEARDK
ncbi:MAG: hypothetical protein HY298_23625 [Verrucomicrobia bacterium]|nr:hypothetical protein [Verrucomicrobiota bacterium]